jgi:hypothetical protein
MRPLRMLLGISITGLAVFLATFQPEKRPAFELETPTFEKLDSKYCVQYGNKNAPIKVVEFFSFLCPHCIDLFQKDFFTIKKLLIDTGQVFFEFHPVPQDLSTVQSIICLGELTSEEKRLFLEEIFEEADSNDPELMSKLMKTAMNVFKKPIPDLDNPSYLQDHPTFEIAFNFIKQGHITAVPTVEINGQLYIDNVPSFTFLQSFVRS